MSIIRASTLQDVDKVSGPTSYSSGGFTVSTNVARADVAIAESMAGGYDADVESTSGNEIVVGVYSEGSGEIPEGTDLSGTDFGYTATKL